MKIIKWVLLGLLGLVVLALAGAVVFALRFDPNQYKGEIERLVHERTGRTLKLAGDLKVAFFPSLGATASGVTLSERGSERTFVAVDSVHGAVAVMPLLHGQVVVDGIDIKGLKASLVKGKDGRYNFSDLLESGKEKAASKAPEKKAAAVVFAVAGVNVERSSIDYKDLASGHELALTDLKLSTGTISDKADGKLAFAVSAKGPGLDARANFSADFKADLPAKAVTVPSISADATLSGAEMPKTLKLAITGNAQADLGKETASADLHAKLDESNIQARLGMAKGFTFDVSIDRLNLDPYFPPKKGAGPAAKAADTPVDLSFLKDLTASGRLQVGALQVKGLKLANLKAEIKAANGRLDVAPHSASLYEGALSGALSAQASGNRIAMKEALSNVSVGPLLRDAANLDRLEGRGNVALEVSGAGPSVNAIKKSLDGTAKLNLRDGAIKGVDIGALLQKAKSLGRSDEGSANGRDQTSFSELNASFVIHKGVAHNQDLDLKAPLVRVGGAGDVDIGNSSLNYTAKASVVASAQGQGGKGLDQLAGLTVPVQLSGPFDSIKYRVDYGAVASQAVKSKVGEKLKEGVGGKLKGLFGR